jgi:hypothetical protein
MARARRVYSAAERRELWERWQQGESISEIGRALDRAPGTILTTLKEFGGIAPPERHRSRVALTLSEREEISRGIAAGKSGRGIARRMGRSPATICREIARHGGRARYRAAEAERRAWRNARRPQPCKLALHGELRELVASKLSEDWSPEQIAGRVHGRTVASKERASTLIGCRSLDVAIGLSGRGRSTSGVDWAATGSNAALGANNTELTRPSTVRNVAMSRASAGVPAPAADPRCTVHFAVSQFDDFEGSKLQQPSNLATCPIAGGFFMPPPGVEPGLPLRRRVATTRLIP